MIEITRQRGEPIVIVYEVSGDSVANPSMRARMKKVAASDVAMPGDSVPAIAGWVTSFAPASGQVPARYTHTLHASATLELAAGAYLMDAALLSGGAVIEITDPIRIILRNSASGAA